MQRRDVLAQARPDPDIAAGRVDIGVARDLVVDDVDTLHMLQRTVPVWSPLRDDDLQFAERVVDVIVARKRLASVRLCQDRHDLDSVQMCLQVETHQASRQSERNHEPLDGGAHVILAELHVVREGAGCRPTGEDLEDPAK